MKTTTLAKLASTNLSSTGHTPAGLTSPGAVTSIQAIPQHLTLERRTQRETVLEKRQRKGRHFAWEEAGLSINGIYARNLEACREQYPDLSPMEHRVCALAKAMMPNWKIGEILGISERTVENHLRATRKKLGLPPGTRMHKLLKF